MDIYEEFGLGDSMDKEEVLEKIDEAIKKLIPRQNVEDINKRNTVLRQMSVLSNSENAIKKAAVGFPNVHLIIKAYAFASDNKKLNYDLTTAVNEAVSGGGAAAMKVTDFLKDCKQDDLRNQWMLWAAECGEVSAYQACGHILTDSDPDQAINWFGKAEAANSIDADSLYDWGLIYYRKKAYDKALPKLEQASEQGHGEAAYYIAVICENGYTGGKNLQKALQMYQLAGQRGVREAQQAVKRVEAVLKPQNASQNNPYTHQDHAQGSSQTANAKPTLVYKSDKKSGTPNLDNIYIDNLKDKIDTDKIKQLSRKKIVIGVIAFLFLTSLLRSCARSILLKHGAENNKFDPFETTVLGEDIISADEMPGAGGIDTNDVLSDADKMEEPSEVEEVHRDLTADEKILVGTYEGYYFSGGRKVGMTLTVYEKNGLEASCKVYPLAGDLGMQAGEYLMDAAYSDGQYIFTATEWVEQPGGYNMLDMSGVLEGEILYGMTNMNVPFSVTTADDKNTVKETWLTDLAYLQADNDITIVEDQLGTANTGDNYMRYIYSRQPYSEIIYQLNGQYDILTAVWAISYNARDRDGTHSFEIYADDELAYTSETIQAGSLPSEVRADIKNCNLLKIRFKEGRDGAELGNIKLSCSKETKMPSNVQEAGKLPTWLTDLEYLTSDRVSVRSEGTTTNTGEEYAHYISGQESGSIEYYLRGEYNQMSAVWAISYNGRDTQINHAFEIYADDELAYSSPALTGGDMPVEVNVDIKYCQVLRIVFTEGNGSGELSNIYLKAIE